MKMKCPHCGVSGSVSDSLLGRKVKCPKCKEIFKVAEAKDFSVPKKEFKKGQVIEASGHVTEAGPAPGMTAQDEAALEQEIAKIFDDMKNSAMDQEPASKAETGSSDFSGSAMDWDMDTKDMRKNLSDSEKRSHSENDLEAELQEMLGGKCSVCGTFVSQKTKHEIGGNIYCSVCLPDGGEAGGESSAGKDLTVTAKPALKNALTGFWQTKGIKLVGIVVIAAILVAIFYQLFFNHK